MDVVRAAGAGVLTGPVRGAAAKVIRSPDWPYVAAGLLGLTAMVEVINRTRGGTDSSVAMLLALCVTLPVALARIQLVAAAVMITVALLLTLLAHSVSPLAGLVGLGLVCSLLGRYRRRVVWVPVIAPYVLYAVTPFDSHPPGGPYLGVLLAALTAGAAAAGAARR